MKKEKGITLIALVITIVILLILSTITINFALGGDGIFEKAEGATEITEQGEANEQQAFDTSMDAWANLVDDPAEESGIYKTTTKITDGLNNIITIPGGFRIADDSGTNVEDGIVIEDTSGNQFVWIPVGEYIVSTSLSSTGKLTNNLARRTFSSSGATELEVNGEITGNLPTEEENSIVFKILGEENENSIANYQIEAFKTSAINNKGFYIGRYEQGGEGQESKAGLTPIGDITRNGAKILSETMYAGNYYVVSQLISSYAWDTALNFICQTNVEEGEGYNLAVTTDKKYGNIGTNIMNKTGGYKVDGDASDKYSNIYDLLGNCFEWTTEYCSLNDYSGVARGTNCYDTTYSGDARMPNTISRTNSALSFRVQLYIN